MSPKALSRFWWTVSAALLLVSSCSHACQICFAVPEKTLADRLLESDLKDNADLTALRIKRTDMVRSCFVTATVAHVFRAVDEEVAVQLPDMIFGEIDHIKKWEKTVSITAAYPATSENIRVYPKVPGFLIMRDV